MIFGYIDPQLSLKFRAHDMEPTLDFQFEKKWDLPGETDAMDVIEMLKVFVPVRELPPQHRELAGD